MLNNEGENRTQLLQTILDTSPNCIYVKDKQGRYIIANKTIAKLYQTTPDEMIGKKDDDFADQAILKPDEAEFFKDIDKKAIETKETQTIPCESFTYNDGTKHYFFTKKIPITYQDDPDCVMGISVDITKLKESQKQALESEEKFRQAFEKSTIGHSLTKPDGTLSQVNSAFASMLGYTVEELSKMNFEDITHPDDIAESNECTHCLLSGEKDCFRFDKRYIHKNGTIVWTDVSTILLRDSEKEPLFFITSIQEITEKKKVEEELKETLNATTDGIWTWNFKTDTLFFSDRYYRMLGYEPQEFEANYENWANLIHPDDKERAIAVAEEYLKNKPDVYENSFRLRTKQGTYRWMRSKARVVECDAKGEAIRMIGTHEDITDKIEKEKQLKESQERYDLAMNATKDGLFDWNLVTNEIYYSPGWKKMLGYEYDELPNDFSVWEKHTDPEDVKRSWNMLNELINKKRDRFEMEFKMKHKDGQWVDILSRANAVFDENDKAVRIVGTHVDISEKKKAEKIIKDNELKYRSYIDNAPNGVFICDETGRYLEVNDKAVEITGYLKDELLNMSIADTLPEERKEIGLHHFQTLLNEGKSVGVTPFVHKDGAVRWWQVNAVKISENRFLAFTQDITEKREMEQKLQRIFDMSSELICEADINTAAFTKINPAFTEVLGYSEKELLSHSFLEFIHPDDKKQTQMVIDEQLQRGEKVISFINRYRCKDGSYVWLDWNSHPVPEKGFTYAIARDITDEKMKEKEIIQSEKETDMILNTAADGIRIVTSDFKIKTMNDTFAEMVGISKEEGVGQYCSDVFKSADCDTDECAVRKVLRTGEGIEKETIRTTFDNREIPCIFRASPYKNEYGEIIGVIEDYRDISSLKRSQARFRNIFENKGTATGIFGNDSIITQCNSKFVDQSGYTKDEIIGKMHWYDFVFQDDVNQMMKFHQQRSEGGKPPGIYECRMVRKNGELVTMIVNIGTIPDSDERIVSLVDISKQKTVENELLRTQEELKKLNENLEAEVENRTAQIQMLLEQKDDFINQLGHDIKNPLGPLVNLLPILENKVTDPKQKDMIRVMNRNVSYIKNLVTRTIQLAQLKSPSTGLKYEEFDLGKEIQDIIGNHQLHFDEKHITVENKIPENMLISADILKMQEVFNNLLNNAVKYNKQDGIIIIEHCVDNDTLTISIKDTGVGMKSEQLERVFDEFYKADSSRHDFDSSGLGMPITKRIIELHGGRIWAESKGPGKGSTFYFTLPNVMESKT